jgi:hypothetical protein
MRVRLAVWSERSGRLTGSLQVCFPRHLFMTLTMHLTAVAIPREHNDEVCMCAMLDAVRNTMAMLVQLEVRRHERYTRRSGGVLVNLRRCEE